jgi:hypothetical protein
MSKVRVDYENVFIKTFTAKEEIPDKYIFNFNSEWVANDSHTKRTDIRKIEVFPMTFTSITRFTFDNPNGGNKFSDVLLFTLTGRKTITEFIDYIARSLNNDLLAQYPGSG